MVGVFVMGGGKELLHYIAAGILVSLMGGLVLFMTYVSIPPDNKDIVTTIVGMLVMGGSMALPRLLGDNEAEKKKAEELVSKAQLEVREVIARLDRLGAKYDILKENYDELIELLVDRHVIEGKGIAEVLKNG